MRHWHYRYGLRGLVEIDSTNQGASILPGTPFSLRFQIQGNPNPKWPDYLIARLNSSENFRGQASISIAGEIATVQGVLADTFTGSSLKSELLGTIDDYVSFNPGSALLAITTSGPAPAPTVTDRSGNVSSRAPIVDRQPEPDPEPRILDPEPAPDPSGTTTEPDPGTGQGSGNDGSGAGDIDFPVTLPGLDLSGKVLGIDLKFILLGVGAFFLLRKK